MALGPIGAFGRLGPQTQIVFSRAPDSLIKLKGSLSSSDSSNPVFKSDVSLSTLGIGGLDEEFGEILRRAFASRILPGQVTAQDGMMHVKGLMLYGPPGTGKTLLARQIGSMLNATPPKIVSGPEILNKYVGQSEENIRNLFKEAEAEYKSKGDDSQLHVIIFDEIDAICRQRGSKNDGTGVGDSIVNQLLSKMDGVESLNNILVIGMTNRLSLIDDALLRPGRFEVQIEVSLPDLTGRREIFEIHTRAMRENKHLAADVDLDELAALTPNYTGAEIRGVIASAYSFACMTKIKVGDSITIDRSKSNEALLITKGYFMKALEEVKPAYGKDNTNLKLYLPNGFLYFSPYITSIVNDLGSLMRDFLLSPTTYITSCLLYGRGMWRP